MYILPKDVHKDTIDIIPYGFEVDIVKDCSSLQKDIADVFNVIDRKSHNFVQTVEKVWIWVKFISTMSIYFSSFLFQFIKTSTELLQYHDFNLNISDCLQSYLWYKHVYFNIRNIKKSSPPHIFDSYFIFMRRKFSYIFLPNFIKADE